MKSLPLFPKSTEISHFNIEFMAKSGKQKKARNFEKEHNEILKGYQHTPFSSGTQTQWSNPGDFFVKFSIYKETSSGSTSSNTSYINK